MTLGSAIKFWLSFSCFTQEYMENITVARRFFEEYITMQTPGILLTKFAVFLESGAACKD